MADPPPSGGGASPPQPERPAPPPGATVPGTGRADELAASTRAVYRQGWAHFAQWCRGEASNPNALPVEPGLVAAYLEAHADRLGASALRNRVAAIADQHRRRGYAFQPSHPAIRAALSSIRLGRQRPVRPAAAWGAPEIARLIAGCTSDCAGPAALAGLRDRALLLIGVVGGLRRAALVAIDYEHLLLHAASIAIHVPGNRPSPDGQASTVTVPRLRDAETGLVGAACPVTALETWLRVAKIRRGPVFRGVTRHGTLEARLSPQAVRLILLKRAAQAGVTVPGSERRPQHGKPSLPKSGAKAPTGDRRATPTDALPRRHDR